MRTTTAILLAICIPTLTFFGVRHFNHFLNDDSDVVKGSFTWEPCGAVDQKFLKVKAFKIDGDIKAEQVVKLNYDLDVLKTAYVQDARIKVYYKFVKVVDKVQSVAEELPAGPLKGSTEFTIPKKIPKLNFKGQVTFRDASKDTLQCIKFKFKSG